MASEASESNTLVILPTGLGKTVIAILVASARLAFGGRNSGGEEKKGEWEEAGRVLVLAPTKPLTVQHRESFMRAFLSSASSSSFSERSFAILTGDSSPEERSKIWHPEEVVTDGPEGGRRKINAGKFVFATPETVLNDLDSGNASLANFSLVVFDEAHRAVKDYAYTEIARTYMEKARDPLILGLTASPGSSPERIGEVKQNLFIENVQARTEEDLDVSHYVEETRIDAVKVKLPNEFVDFIVRPLKSLYSEKIEKLKRLGVLPPATLIAARSENSLSKKLLLESRSVIVSRLSEAERNSNQRFYLYGALVAQAQAVMIQHAIELAETQGLHTLGKYLERLRNNPEQGKSAKALLKDQRWTAIENTLRRLQRRYSSNEAHPKIAVLNKLVGEQFERKEDSKVIVFTQYRDTIDSIASSLSGGLSSPSSSSSIKIKPQRFVGQSAKSETDRGMSQKLQSEILEKFRGGKEFNVLVSSSIGEEGLHVPDVDLVVFYEAVPSEIRSIQRKGRTGRTMPGRVVILLSEGTVDESYYYTTMYKERRMKRLLLTKDVDEGKNRGEFRGNDDNKKKEPETTTTLLDFLD